MADVVLTRCDSEDQAAATRGVVSEAVATQVCDCTLAGINARFDANEKLALTAEQAQPITAECMSKAGLQ